MKLRKTSGHNSLVAGSRRRLNAKKRKSLFGHEARQDRAVRLRWRVEMVLLGIGAVVALVVGWTQLGAVQNSLKSSTAASVYEQQQGLDQMFIDMPEFAPYFEEKKEVPPEHAAQARAIAYRTLDHFEHVRFQIVNDLFSGNQTAWHSYISESFRYSPVLCRTLLESSNAYGGMSGPHSVWENFAETPCRELSITEAIDEEPAADAAQVPPPS